MSVRVKICGLKREADVHIACEAGADFCGFVVEVPNSPRSLAREQVRPLLAMVEALPVVVTRQKSADDLLVLVRFLAPYAIQLHGDEPPELVAMVKRQTSCAVWKALPLPPTSHPRRFPEAPFGKSPKFCQGWVRCAGSGHSDPSRVWRHRHRPVMGTGSGVGASDRGPLFFGRRFDP